MNQYNENSVDYCKQICMNYALASQFICNKYGISEKDLKLLMFLNGVGRYTLYTILVTYKNFVDMRVKDNNRFIKKGYVQNVRTTQTNLNNRLKNQKYHIFSLTNESIIILKELYKTLISVDIKQNLDLKYRTVNKIAKNNREAAAKTKEINMVMKEILREAEEKGIAPQMPDFDKDFKLIPDSWMR